VAPDRPDPVMVTAVPADPPIGRKLVITGVTVKFVALGVVTPPAVTLIRPDVARLGTTATIVVDVLLVTTASTRLNETAVALSRLVPVMVTLVPVGPLLGEKLMIAGVTVKRPGLVATPSGVVSVM